MTTWFTPASAMPIWSIPTSRSAAPLLMWFFCSTHALMMSPLCDLFRAFGWIQLPTHVFAWLIFTPASSICLVFFKLTCWIDSNYHCVKIETPPQNVIRVTSIRLPSAPIYKYQQHVDHPRRRGVFGGTSLKKSFVDPDKRSPSSKNNLLEMMIL